MSKIIIIGNGIASLIANYMLQQCKNIEEIKIIEPNNIDNDYLVGDLKYIYATNTVEKLFKKLKLTYSSYIMQGGILLKGEIKSHPKCFRDMQISEFEQLQSDFYIKTRLIAPECIKKNMNGLFNVKHKRAIHCDLVELMNKFSFKNNILKKDIMEVDNERIIFNDNNYLQYDHLIITIPIWHLKQFCKIIDLPDSVVVKSNIIRITPKYNKYARWDYIYTPYTPADLIYKISSECGDYFVETSGELNYIKLYSDLNFLFPDGWWIRAIYKDLRGYLLSNDKLIKWPNNVKAIGKYAKLDTNMTIDTIIEDVNDIINNWFGGKK